MAWTQQEIADTAGQEIGKDEILGALKQLRQTVSRYSVEGKDMIRLKRYLLHSVSKTLAAMNAVNLEQPGKLTFKKFAETAAEMHHVLNGFLLALDDPLYRRQLLQEIRERKEEKEEGDGTDYVAELGEDQEVRDALKDLIAEVMDERQSEDNP